MTTKQIENLRNAADQLRKAAEHSADPRMVSDCKALFLRVLDYTATLKGYTNYMAEIMARPGKEYKDWHTMPINFIPHPNK